MNSLVVLVLSLIVTVSGYMYNNDHNETHSNNYTYDCDELYNKLFTEEIFLSHTLRKELSQMLFQLCYNDNM